MVTQIECALDQTRTLAARRSAATLTHRLKELYFLLPVPLIR
jgi:hypothetical protein